jgi:hypothetical protein
LRDAYTMHHAAVQPCNMDRSRAVQTMSPCSGWNLTCAMYPVTQLVDRRPWIRDAGRQYLVPSSMHPCRPGTRSQQAGVANKHADWWCCNLWIEVGFQDFTITFCRLDP